MAPQAVLYSDSTPNHVSEGDFGTVDVTTYSVEASPIDEEGEMAPDVLSVASPRSQQIYSLRESSADSVSGQSASISDSATTSEIDHDPARLSDLFDATIDESIEHAETRSSLMNLIGSLHSTGIQREVDLPKIVVIGSQSVGKSSLIESISQIKLPRDSGTCTRCPMECRLGRALQWSCDIHLRLAFDTDGVPLKEVNEVTFGSTLFDPADVEKQLRRAQRAILRPDIDLQNFLNDDDLTIAGKKPLSFSHNCVCLRVTGPKIPDLFFYDLPGIIANVREDGDPNDVTLVEDLAKRYIRQPNCLILLAISCDTDYENQGAGKLVLHDSNLTDRTIGVLTKPDRIETGTAGKWITLFRKEHLRSHHGWFCVKLSNPQELRGGISWEEARDLEKNFFLSTDPWNCTPYVWDRLGSKSLTNYLSITLTSLMYEKLPQIRWQVTSLLERVNADLDSIPEPDIKDPVHHVMRLALKFSVDAKAEIDGKPEENDEQRLIQSFHKVYNRFLDKVHKTAPRFRPWNRGEMESEAEASYIARLEEDTKGTGRILYLDETSELIARARTRELPGHYPFEVINRLILSSTEQWGKPLEECFDSINARFKATMKCLVQQTFKHFTHARLDQKVLTIVCDLILQLYRETKRSLNDVLSAEDLPHSTLNEHDWESCKITMMQKYREHRVFRMAHSTLSKKETERNLSIAIEAIRNMGLQVTEAQIFGLPFSDPRAAPALDIMAEVRAYFEIAHKRFVDEVSMHIDKNFVRKFSETIQDRLLARLGLTEPEAVQKCADWLVESPDVVLRRQRLVARKKILESAQEELMRHEMTRGS
ncbi:hypothetical protein SISSUDRAFT_1066199 [Sistotremastrum suecicum HHB10207 ss-3]|uniref:P-loop containing nucleoside triphosphate hydrolase protein n=1 Tax=Sistotremastrum suecicum HHB10207 ss-3 TaxID=1314776 RepID=A0A165YKP9_9AGAM|nr:hypothetical protein SISSUDRAFT_1066199 [Sistotremastrum suecicum HHB10207 ss-3]